MTTDDGIKKTTTAPNGVFDLIRNERRILTTDSSSALARLASMHEGQHDFLNQSTYFGNAITFSGALAEAGHGRFSALVGRLANMARYTHELFATVSSLCAQSRGAFDLSLLEQYPSYREYVERFHACFGHHRPYLSTIELTSCVRAAMQTDILDTLLATPCDQWPDIMLSPTQQPDFRLREILTADLAEQAMGAMIEYLVGQNSIDPRLMEGGLSPDEEGGLLATFPLDIQDGLGEAAYGVFAAALANGDFAVGEYQLDRTKLGEIVAKLEAFAGDTLKAAFQMPQDPDEDSQSVFVSYRREQLVLNPTPALAGFIWAPGHEADLAGNFIIDHDGTRLLQLAAMPLAKARALYRDVSTAAVLSRWPKSHVTGLRRRSAPKGMEPVVEMLLLEPAALPSILEAHPGISILAIAAMSATNDLTWREEWMTPGAGPVSRLVVVLDTDPTALILRHSADGATIHLTTFGVRLSAEHTDRVEVLTMAADAQPGVLFVMPCTAAYRQAVVQFARRRCRVLTVDGGFLASWRDILHPALGHILREEGRFGSGFWL